jgi:hypothetical protein
VRAGRSQGRLEAWRSRTSRTATRSAGRRPGASRPPTPARELWERQLRLRSGAPSSAEDVARARAAAEQAALHDVVADTEERAAQADPARAGEHEELAARHRGAARRDRAEAARAEPGR